MTRMKGGVRLQKRGGRMEKKAIFMCVSLLTVAGLCPGLAAAKGDGHHQESTPEILSEKYLKTLDIHLGLSDQQQKKIEGVLEDAKPGIKKNWKKIHDLRKEIRALAEQLQGSMRDTQEKIRAELDGEQKEKFDEMRIQMKRNMEKMPRRRRPGQPLRESPQKMPPDMDEFMKQRGMEIPPGGGRHMREMPEQWDIPPRRGREDLPPEIREHIHKRREMRENMPKGSQRDLPPVEEWEDPRMPDTDNLDDDNQPGGLPFQEADGE